MKFSQEFPIYKAKVISIEDEDEKGRIQVQVLPQFKSVDKEILPWARPLFMQGATENHFSFHPPEVNSMVWVVFLDEYWKTPYWLPGQFIYGFFDYSTVKDSLDNISELSDTTYPNISFTKLPSGDIFFYNKDSGEEGIFHNSGAYTIYDTDGNVISYTPESFKLYNDKATVTIDKSGDMSFENDNFTQNMNNDGSFKVENESGVFELTSTGTFDVNDGNLQVLP